MESHTDYRPASSPGSPCVHTTLYELIEAIGEAVGPGEDDLIARTILNMLDSGRIKFHRPSQPAEPIR